MRFALLACLFLLATPVHADCADEIAALFHGGALDPALVGTRRETVETVYPNGRRGPFSTTWRDGPRRSIFCLDDVCTLAIDRQRWRATSPDGPWTRDRSLDGPDTRADSLMQVLAGMTEAHCPGRTTLGGRATVQYSLTTTWNKPGYRAMFTWWIDVETGRELRMQIAKRISPGDTGPSGEIEVVTYDYAHPVHIRRPD